MVSDQIIRYQVRPRRSFNLKGMYTIQFIRLFHNECTCIARFKNTALLKKVFVSEIVLRVGDKGCNIQELS